MTVKCKDCGGVVSKNADACPHCGSRQFDKFHEFAEGAGALIGLGCGIVVLVIGVLMIIAFLKITSG